MLRKIALVLAVVPGLWLTSAFALSLGEISVNSQLNQRFSAVIPLYDVSAEDAAALRVKVADNAAFAKAGIERPAYLSSLSFKVKTENGASEIVVSSDKIAREPFLSFLLDVNSKGAQLMRAYTVLLDPPDYSEPIATAAAAPAPAAATAAEETPEVAEPVTSAPEPTPIPAPAPAQAAAPEPAAAPAAPAVAVHASPVSPVAPEASDFTPASATPSAYGPVKSGETLWHIATQLRASNSVTMNQVMLAIHDANPHAFDDGRLHVQKGAMLKVPTLAQIRAVSPTAAAERIDQLKRGSTASAAATKPAASATPAKPKVAEQPAAASVAASAAKTEAASKTPAVVATGEEPAAAVQGAEPTTSAATSSSAAAAAESNTAEPAQPSATAPAAEPSTEPAATTAPADTLPGSVPTANADTATTASSSEPSIQTQPQPIAPAQTESKPKAIKPTTALMQGMLYPLIAALVVLLLGLLGLQSWKKRQSAKSRRKIEPVQGLKFGIPQQTDEVKPEAPAVKIPELPTAAAAVAATQKISDAEDTAQLPQFDSTQMIDAPADAKTNKGISTDTVDFDVTGKFEAETMKVDLDGDDPITEADFHLAYGLYDEAALLLTTAAQKEPARTDIRTKLAETYFRAGKAVEFQETAETLKPEVTPAEWQKIAIMGHQLMPDSELFSSGGNLDAESLGHDVDLSFDEPATQPASATAKPEVAEPAPQATHTLDFSLEDFDAAMTPTSTTPAAAPAPTHEVAPEAAASDNTLEFNLDDFDLEKPAAKESVATVEAPTISVDEVKIDDDFSLDNMPDDSHAISTGDEAATKLDLARAYVDMGDNETAVTLLNEVMQQGTDEQKSDAEALIKRMS